VGLVAPYPPARCGIGDYTAALARALGDEVDVEIIAERCGELRRAWHRREDWPKQILAAAVRAQVQVAHVQHEESILGQDARLPWLVDALRAQGIATVVTLHSVYGAGPAWPPWRMPAPRFHRALVAAGAVLVVHQRRGMADRLMTQGVPTARVAIIPHGTPELALPERASARAALDLPADTPIAAFLGFIHPKKGVDTLVRAFVATRAAAERRACLVIAGEHRDRSPIDRVHARRLTALVDDACARAHVVFRPGFIPPEDLPAYLAAADVLCLPHRQAYGSASGVLHNALAAGRAVVCADGLKFAELVDRLPAALSGLCPPPGMVGPWAEALDAVLGDGALRVQAAAFARRLGADTSWAVSALQHRLLYMTLVQQPRRASRALEALHA
jgi:glycosyltransferase involved in cell wall biosynthesis